METRPLSRCKVAPPRGASLTGAAVLAANSAPPKQKLDSLDKRTRIRISARAINKTVALRFAGVRDQGMAEAYVVWSRLLDVFGGRTTRVAARFGPARGKEHIMTLLKRWSHRTLCLHAANVLKFVEWQKQR